MANALAAGHELRYCSYRDHTPLSAGQVDDTPFGGGAGMVLRVDVVDAAVRGFYGRDSLFHVYGAPDRVQHIELGVYFPLLLLAVLGLVILRRLRRLAWPLLMPVGMTTLIAALAWGSGRFRSSGDVAITVLAAVAITGLWRSRGRVGQIKVRQTD